MTREIFSFFEKEYHPPIFFFQESSRIFYENKTPYSGSILRENHTGDTSGLH
ncbi:MAG: hypothetical protein ACFFBL_12755 [Promethearchaeota archaeon]